MVDDKQVEQMVNGVCQFEEEQLQTYYENQDKFFRGVKKERNED